MKKLLLILLILFAIIFSFGTSFMEYKILDPTTDSIMTIAGVIGMLVTGIKFCKL